MELYITESKLEIPSSSKVYPTTVPLINSIRYILSGYGYFNGKRLGKGQAFIITKNQRATYFPDEQEPWGYIYFDIDGTKFKDFVSKFNLAENGGIFEFDCFDELEKIYRQYIENDEYKYNHYIRNAVAWLLFSQFEKRNTADVRLSLQKKHVDDIEEYINQNYNKSITMDSIAEKFNLNRAYMRNIFVKEKGIPPKKYLTMLRIEQAKRLLDTRKFSVSKIAYSVGYEDVFHFSKLFKKYCNESPAEYMKNVDLREINNDNQ